jgi:hypothetical protein
MSTIGVLSCSYRQYCSRETTQKLSGQLGVTAQYKHTMYSEHSLSLLFLHPTQTNNAPNSWANIALWRRFFKEKEEQDRLLEQMILEVLDEHFSVEKLRPVMSWMHADQRRLETLKAHRDSVRLSTPPLQGLPAVDLLTRTTTMADATRVTLPGWMQHPAVHVPAGDDPARYMPQ